MIKTIISWDLGATKCAVAIVEYNEMTNEFHCKNQYAIRLKHCQSLEELTEKIEDALSVSMLDADAISIGAAGNYDGQILHHALGYPYSMHFAQLAKEKKWPPFVVIHDYATIVCATFTSYMDQSHSVKRLNTSSMNSFGRRVALGVGTGLGLKDGILFEDGNFWLGVNEIGHMGVSTPPETESYYHERHRELIRFLRSQQSLKTQEPLTFETILSGRGAVSLYRFLHADSKELTPEDIGKKMRSGQANETLSMLAWYLGLFVGNVQLAYMPDGGVWMTGGVILKNMGLFDHPEFFHGIEATPAYLAKRKEFPLGVLCNPEHAFIGAAFYAVKRLLK